jgi:ATP synthase protein I
MSNQNENIAKLKEKIESYKKTKQKKSQPKKESGAGLGFKISTELVAALVVGVGIGLLVDNYLGTNPFGLIIFFIIGAFAGFLNVYRVMRRIEKQ